MAELGPIATMTFEEPAFAGLLWKMSPASLAVRLSNGKWQPWPYLQLLSRKLVDVAMGRCPRLIVTLPPRHGKPIHDTAAVQLPDGSTKLLKDIQVGDFVVTHKARGRKVLAVYEQPAQDSVLVTTKTGREIILALDHTVMSSVGWLEAGNLKIGQGLALLRNFEPARPSDRSVEEFRLTGYLIGDGSVKKGFGSISVTDKIEAADIVTVAASLNCSCTVRETDINILGLKPWVVEVGLAGKGAYEKRIPDWAFCSSNEQAAHLLAGYFTTDGAVNDPKICRKSGDREGDRIGPVFEYCSVSRALLEDTRRLLSRLDIHGNVRPKLGKYKGEDHHSWRLIISDRTSLLNFLEIIRPYVHHSAKRKLLDEWDESILSLPSREPRLTMEQIEEIRNSSLSYNKLSAKYNLGKKPLWNIKKGLSKCLPHHDDYFFDEIVSLSATKADCRCLSVEEDETFVAQDFVVHNSEMVSRYFPVWFLETFHNKRVILCSYEAEFAAKWGGKARDLIADNQDILGVRFKNQNPSMHYWETDKDPGGMMCAGVGGPITGKGADLMIIDDFVKNSQEANSLTVRESTWEWWLTTARSRLEPGAGVVIMATRWHSDDLIGRLINRESYSEKGTQDAWEVFNLPAIAEPESDLHYAQFGVKVNNLRAAVVAGTAQFASTQKELENDDSWTDVIGRKRGEALCPDRYDENDLAKIRGGSSEKTWFSLYQQRPGDEADDGNVYYTFDEKVNVRPTVYDQHKQLFVSMDFNVDPMCAVIGQYDPLVGMRQMERCEILEELVLGNSNTYQLCEVLMTRLQRYRVGYTLVVEIFGDAAGVQRTANSKKTNWQIVADHFALHTNIHTRFVRKKDNPNIADRVNAVNSMLRSADGTTRLYIDVSCRELRNDFLKVRWQEDPSGNTRTGLLDKSDKKRTHISDALGYMVEYKYALRTRSGGKKGFLQ